MHLSHQSPPPIKGRAARRTRPRNRTRADLAALVTKELLVMDRNLRSNVMEGRIANLIRANLWSTFNHFPKCLEDSCVSIAAIGLGVLFLIPQADSENFRSPRDNERDFVLEAFLLQTDGDATSKHGNLLKVGFLTKRKE